MLYMIKLDFNVVFSFHLPAMCYRSLPGMTHVKLTVPATLSQIPASIATTTTPPPTTSTAPRSSRPGARPRHRASHQTLLAPLPLLQSTWRRSPSHLVGRRRTRPTVKSISSTISTAPRAGSIPPYVSRNDHS